MPIVLVFLAVLSVVQALPCLTTGSKKDFDKTRAALNGLESLLSSTVTTLQTQIGKTVSTLQSQIGKTVTTLQGQINGINGKVKALDKDLIAMESDIKRRQWMKYNDHCYFFGTEGAPWTTAERKCREIGGYLAKVDDANENAWIFQKMIKAKKGSHFWLGMTDVYNGDWRWIYDETKPKYQNWNSGNPFATSSSYSKNYNCVFVLQNNGKWYDHPCNHSTSYVCESNFCFS